MKRCLIMFMPFLFILTPLFLSAATNPCWSVAISSSPSPAYAGDTMTFSARLWIKFEAIRNLRVIGVVDGVRFYDNTFASLAAGTTRDISFTWPATLGDHTAYFQIDPDDTVAEVGTDNMTEMAFSIGARPPATPLNLSFSSNSIAPGRLSSGEESYINYSIWLPDSPATPFDVSVVLRVDGVQVASKTHRFEGRSAASDRFVWNVVCGANLEVVIDPLNAIIETNEADNTWTSPVVCNPFLPNLIIPRSLTNWTPEYIHTGDRVTINYTISNIGEGESAAYDVGLKVGGRIVARNSHSAHRSGVTQTGTITWTAECTGPWELVADCDEVITESNETDNSLENEFFGCAVPNLVALRFNRAVLDGETEIPSGRSYVHYFNFRLDNDTNVPNVRVRIGIVGGSLLHDEILPTVNMGGRVISTGIDLAPGSYTLYAMVDPDNTIAESNESDNRLEFFVRIVGEATTDDSRHELIVPVTKNNYKIIIENKKALQKGDIIHSTDNWILGTLSNSGNTGTLAANVPVRLTEENKITGLTRVIWEEAIHLRPNGTYKIKWRWNPASAGKYKLTLGIVAPGTDAIPADNKDDINVTVK